MSFEGHSLTSTKISHLAEIHSVSSPRLVLRLLDVIYVFLFLLKSGETGRSSSHGSHTQCSGSGHTSGSGAVAGSLCLWFCCCARVSSLAAGMRMGSVPSLECGLSDRSSGFTAGEEEAALRGRADFKRVYLHFR